MFETERPPLAPSEGMVVCHLFFRFDRKAWEEAGPTGRLDRAAHFSRMIGEMRQQPATQLLSLSMLSGGADIGFMLVTGDLHRADILAKALAGGLGPGMLAPASAYLSLTEQSEYVTTEQEHAENLSRGGKIEMGGPEFDREMEAFRKRMEKYRSDKLRPNLPDWPVVCFYPMLKRRGPGQNWYALPFEKRKQLMGGHARIGRNWHGRILQLITGSTGLDAMEWGVTLFASDIAAVKGIVYEMRFDEVSAAYAEFGEFHVGLQLPPEEILRRLGA
jgi:chlorite dismutase